MKDRGELRIDRAESADIPLLAELNFQLMEDEAHPYPLQMPALLERMSRWIEGEYHVLLIRRGDRIAGYAVWRLEEHGAYLRHFFICRDQRREGLGRQAMALLRREAFPTDRPLLIEAAIWNKAAIDFWHAIGFKDFGLSMELKAGETIK
ncbi:MAG: GNAT family N-acetyltransferase, partial [Dongiaceae bacterium]